MRGAVSFAAAVAAIACGMAIVVAIADDGFPGDGSDPSCSCRPLRSHHRVRAAGRWDYTYPAEHWRFWWYANRARLADVTHRTANNAAVTVPGVKPPAGPEPWRDAVRSALHSVLSAKSRAIVCEAALSLGRGGDARDARALAAIVADGSRDAKERSRAALGLALVDVSKAPEDAREIRETLLAAAREARGNYDDRCELWGNCLYALGVRGDPAALPTVREIAVSGASVKDEELHRDVVCSAASALGMFRDDLVVPDLTDLVRRPEPPDGDKRRAMYISVYAAHGLAKIGSHAALAALCEAAGDEREEVRRAVVMAIGALAGPEDDAAEKVLAQIAREDRFLSCRNMACIGLGRSGHPSAVRVLTDVATKRPATDRPYALLGLGLFARRTKDAAVRTFLGERLADSGSADEMGAVATANGLAENEAAVPQLVALTDGGMPELRGWAAYALGLLHSRDRRVAPRLHELVLDQGDPILRREAALALGLVGDMRAVPQLCEIVRHGKNVVDRGSAAVALGRIGGSDAADCLIGVLRDEDEPQELRACVAEGLGYLLDKDEGRRLSQIVSDLDWYELTEPTMRALYLVD
jgi:HEAT repeat protein